MSKGVQIAVVVACLAAAAVMLWRYFASVRPGADEGMPRMLFFLCTDPQCAMEYAVRPGEELGGREADECPKCGGGATVAARCPACGRFHPEQGHGRYLENCPHCGAKMPPLAEQVREGERAMGG